MTDDGSNIQNPTPRQRVKYILKVVAIQVSILLVLLFVLDIALWVFAPKRDNEPSNIKLVQTLNGVKEEIVYTTIGYGIRSDSLKTLSKPEGSVRMLCLGASTTQQPMQETKDTWCAILERKLRLGIDDNRIKFHSLSYGSAGAKVVDSAIWMSEMFDKIQPDIVVTLLGINDLARNGGPNFKVRRVQVLIDAKKNKNLAAKSNLFAKIKRVCVEISQICRYSQLALYNLDSKKKLAEGRLLDWHSKHLPRLRAEYRSLPRVFSLMRHPDPIEEFGGAIDWLFDFLKKRGVDVVVLGQPVLWKPTFSPREADSLWFGVNTSAGAVRPSGSWLLREMRKYNNLQKTKADNNEFSYIDLDRHIPKTLEYYFDDCHYTDKGSAMVADAIFPTLLKTLNKIIRNKTTNIAEH